MIHQGLFRIRNLRLELDYYLDSHLNHCEVVKSLGDRLSTSYTNSADELCKDIKINSNTKVITGNFIQDTMHMFVDKNIIVGKNSKPFDTKWLLLRS